MNLLQEYDEFRDDGDISEEVLRHCTAKAGSAVIMVPMGKRFFIRVVRSYHPIEGGVDGHAKLDLIFMGPQKGGEVLMQMECTDMLQVMAHTAKLIEDRKDLRWNEAQRRWVF